MDALTISMIVVACVLAVITIALFIVMVRIATKNPRLPKPLYAVDLNRYKGKWNEISKIPIIFENGCQRVTAEYSIEGNPSDTNKDFYIKVDNKCYSDKTKSLTTDNETFRQSIGRAVPNRLSRVLTNAKNPKELFVSPAALRVSFFKPFYGNYEIYDLGPINKDGLYETAAVGSPGLFSSSLWILSRESQLSKEKYDGIVKRLIQKKVPGISRLRLTNEKVLIIQ